jgi:hypothetical protein
VPTGQLTEADYLAARRLHFRWPWWRGVVVGVAFLLAIIACGQMIRGANTPESAGFVLACGVLGAIIGVVILRLAYVPWQSRKVFREQETLRRPFEVTWDAGTLTRRSATGETRTPWSDFIRWKEDGGLFLLYHSDGAFQVLPKRVLGDAAAVAIFRGLLEQHVKSR